VSLQKRVRKSDEEALESAACLWNPAAELDDFSDTAAVCECLDGVISVDTSVAHLSAALGKRTWILLPYSAAWRWLLDRDDSPWYPSVRLFRQEAPGDWRGALERIAAQLQTLGANPECIGAADSQGGRRRGLRARRRELAAQLVSG
jgi:ADP-heptose:LPS heptosyltransferase